MATVENARQGLTAAGRHEDRSPSPPEDIPNTWRITKLTILFLTRSSHFWQAKNANRAYLQYRRAIKREDRGRLGSLFQTARGLAVSAGRDAVAGVGPVAAVTSPDERQKTAIVDG